MSPKRTTVARLAEEADLELDEALVLLWDSGLDELTEPGDFVPDRKLSTAKRALGLATARQLRSITHLAEASGLTKEEARSRLAEAGLITSRTGDRLPKGTLKKSRKVLGLQHAGGFSRLVAAAHDELTPLPPPEDLLQFEWNLIGTAEKIEYLSSDEVERIHFSLAEDFARSGDPIRPAGVRDAGLLESAVSRPLTALGGEFKYPTVPMAAAALFHSLALNHAFHNGNKRTALVALLVFLDRNKYLLDVTEQQVFKEVLLVAQHRVVPGVLRPHADHEVLVIAEWIHNNMRRAKRDEYPLQWRHLRRVLTEQGCEFEVKQRGGLLVKRSVPRWIFGGRRVLKSHVPLKDDGSDADATTVHKIRKDLCLDEEHGVDSEVFYRGRPVVDGFVAKYRKTLVRLARL